MKYTVWHLEMVGQLQSKCKSTFSVVRVQQSTSLLVNMTHLLACGF